MGFLFLVGPRVGLTDGLNEGEDVGALAVVVEAGGGGEGKD